MRNEIHNNRDPHLRPWLVPRWAINEFCEIVRSSTDPGADVYVQEIIEHSLGYYLVVTHGEYPWIFNKLTEFLNDLWSVPKLEAGERART